MVEDRALLTQLVELASGRRESLAAADTATPPLPRENVDCSANELAAKLFNRWLCLPLEQQMADLRRHLIATGGSQDAVVRAWLRDRSYRNLIPEGTMAPAEQLFMADMDVLLRLYSTLKSDCRECLEALQAMLRGLQLGFMRIGTLQEAEALYAKVSPECRTYCLTSLGPAMDALHAGEFARAWDDLSSALAAVRSRYEA
jgi:hypothetical protein